MNLSECIADIYEKCYNSGTDDCAGQFHESSFSAFRSLNQSAETRYAMNLMDWPEEDRGRPQTDDALPAGITTSEKEGAWSRSLYNIGDMLVGFYLSPEWCDAQPVSVNLKISLGSVNISLGSVMLRPGKTSFALEGRYIVPLLCMRFMETRLQLSNDAANSYCYLVGAYLQPDLRHACCIMDSLSGTLRSGQSFSFGSGMLGVGPGCPSAGTPTVVLPMAPEYWPGAAEKRVWHAKIDRELMAAAWHPKRMAFWCCAPDDDSCCSSSNDEEKEEAENEEEEEAYAGAVVSVLRLGEVMVIDGALRAAEVARLAVLADAVDYLGLHECPEALQLMQCALSRANLAGVAMCKNPRQLATLGHSRERAMHQDGALVGGELSVVAFLDRPVAGGQISFFPTFYFPDSSPLTSSQDGGGAGAGGGEDATAPTPPRIVDEPPITVASRAGRLVVFGVYLPHKVAAPQGVKRIAGCEARWYHAGRDN